MTDGEEEEEVLHPSFADRGRRLLAYADGQINVGKTFLKSKSAPSTKDSSSSSSSSNTKDKDDNDRVDRVDDVLEDFKRRISREMKNLDASLDVIFNELDVNHDGLLSMKEIQAGIEKVGITVDSSEAATIIETFSNDGGNTVRYKDFLKAMALENAMQEYTDDTSGVIDVIREGLRAGPKSPTEIKSVFGACDTKGDHTISRKDFAAAMTALGTRLRTREMEILYKHFDINKDGRINYEEFIRFVGLEFWVDREQDDSSTTTPRHRHFSTTTQFLSHAYLGEVALNRERLWPRAVFSAAGAKTDGDEGMPAHVTATALGIAESKDSKGDGDGGIDARKCRK